MLLMPFVALFGLVFARSATGDRVLVVLESAVTKDDYSQFWDSLQRTQIPYKCHDILTTKQSGGLSLHSRSPNPKTPNSSSLEKRSMII